MSKRTLPKTNVELTRQTGLTAAERRMRAQLAAHKRWATEDDRGHCGRAGQDALTRRWERQVDPDGKLTAEERALRVASLRKEHMTRMAFASARARRLRARLGEADDTADTATEIGGAE
jgi:hypothetical protein